MNQTELENILFHLNYRWGWEALSQWRGEKIPFEPYEIYEGFENFLDVRSLDYFDQIQDTYARRCLKHNFIDHYLQTRLLPHETEMRAWMRGAAAHVNGRKIYFREIIHYCQKESSFEERQILQKETRPLSKFLKPFALNHWQILFEVLKNDLGFDNYLDYCCQKKGIDYSHYYQVVKGALEDSDEIYFRCMDNWAQEHLQRPLDQLTRFDAIYLLGLGQFDLFFPEMDLDTLTTFFQHWDIDVRGLSNLHLDLGKGPGKSAQAICFLLSVPSEVYVLMKPEGGWIDLETLWHELGHGLSAVHVSPDLDFVNREMTLSSNLTETYAFLFQNFCFSSQFLLTTLNLNDSLIKKLRYYKVLKEMAIFRRYAAKYLSEYEMFLEGDIENGDRYANIMANYTGFSYQSESHLFDLVPEFYCLEYVLAMMAEPIIEAYLEKLNGEDWIYHLQTGKVLKKWWNEGNHYDIVTFLKKNGLDELNYELLLKRWKEVLRNGETK